MTSIKLFDRRRYLILILIFVCAAFAFSAESKLSIAPANPDFVLWQSRMQKMAETTKEGFILGEIPSPVDRSHLISETLMTLNQDKTAEGAPSSYDLRTFGEVSSVKNQGSCGSCWTFGTYGSLESWLLKNVGEAWDFSENHLKNSHGLDWGPCEGGNVDIGAAYLSRWSGPVRESDDPYHDYSDSPSPGGPVQKYVENILHFIHQQILKMLS